MLRPLSAVVLLLAAPAAFAQTWLQNDTFTGQGAVNASADFQFLEGASVILSAADAGGPVTVLGIDVLCAPFDGASSGLYLDSSFDVWSDQYIPDAGPNPWPPSTRNGDILDSSAGQTGLISSTSQFTRVSFPSPVVLDGGSIFVRILNNNDPSLGTANDATIAADQGPLVPGMNFYNHSYFGYLPLPYDAGTFYIGGNWIIRAVLPGGGGPPDSGGPPVDAGGPGNDAGSSGSDAGAPTPDSGNPGGGDGGVTAGLTLTSINPNVGYSEDDTSVILLGTGFQPGVVAIIGTNPLTSLTRTSAAVINATVPSGITAGVYDVLVVNPDGTQASLKNGFTVNQGTRVGTGCRCQSTSATATWLLIGLLAWSSRRRPYRRGQMPFVSGP